MRTRLQAGLVAVLALALTVLAPAPAFAYFNRGSVGVSTGVSAVTVAAGETVDVSVSFDPASDEQTQGCGMPKCPQSCSAECADDNGQCRCGGTEYTTYYPDAVAATSDASVATASYDAGRVRVTGVGAGTATVTVTGSLRQFEDGVATVSVTVEGEAPAGAASVAAAVETPDEATVDIEDRAEDATLSIMGRPIRYVKLTDALGAADVDEAVASVAGVDGDLTFWSGDTYYQPLFSVTLAGTDWPGGGAFAPRAEVAYEPTGALTQPLDSQTGFVSVAFSEPEAWGGPALVFVQTQGAVEDGADARLYSWDSDSKRFVAEDAEVIVEDGYASFSVQEGKIYVISTADLAAEAAPVVKQATASCCDTSASASAGLSVPFVVAIVVVVVAVAVLVTYLVMKKKAAHEKK
jgi:hypothetical protein